MSIPFGKHFGATFREAIIVLEALTRAEFKSPEKLKAQASMINYMESKLWSNYPYQCEDYFHKNPTPRRPELDKAEREQ